MSVLREQSPAFAELLQVVLPNQTNSPSIPPRGKRAGSAKRSKKQNFEFDEEKMIEPSSTPENAKFNGDRSYDVQESEIRRHLIRFK